ncbi:MAG: hypothetical protein LBH34_01735, partial [Prevotellaceae bacterium]|nr:hypothetical protein [Prevotellaceae bacterium]
MKKILLYMFALVALVTTGCSGTSLITSWTPDESETVIKYKKIMIIGLLGNRFIELRQKTEAIVAKDLTNIGINAISAYETFGPKEFQQLNEKEVVSKMKELGVDAVMFIALLDRIKEKDWIPG